MNTIDITYDIPADLSYLFMLIYILISVVLREEMLACFVTFAFIKSILVGHYSFPSWQYSKVYRTRKESCPHKEQVLVFPKELPRDQYFVYHNYENSRWEKAAENNTK